MAPNPVLFALANPIPEILSEEALSVRTDVIMATGRSDYPNQVNNVLGFPGIFRGALDVRAKAINDEMKLAASHALAAARARGRAGGGERSVRRGARLASAATTSSPSRSMRACCRVASAVAKAAVETGVARITLDRDAYVDALRRRQGRTYEVMSVVVAALPPPHDEDRVPRRQPPAHPPGPPSSSSRSAFAGRCCSASARRSSRRRAKRTSPRSPIWRSSIP